MKIKFQLFFLSLLILLLSGCGFHANHLLNLAPYEPIYLDFTQVEDQFSAILKRRLCSAGVQIAPSPQTAKSILQIHVAPIEYDEPPIVDSTSASTIYYRIHTHIQLLNAQGISLKSAEELTIALPVLTNANQVYLSREAYRLAKRELFYSMTTLIYNHLETYK